MTSSQLSITEAGRKGGTATFKKYGRSHMKKLAKNSARVRSAKANQRLK